MSADRSTFASNPDLARLVSRIRERMVEAGLRRVARKLRADTALRALNLFLLGIDAGLLAVALTRAVL